MNRVVVNVSNRHIHIMRQHINSLFGQGYNLTVKKFLMEPLQFAAQETLTVCGPAGEIENVRIVGPEREKTQIELSVSDARKIGVNAPVRLSGDTARSAAITLKGPAGTLDLSEGCIVAKRHIHFPLEEAAAMGLKSGDSVLVKTSGIRGLIFDNVIVRTDKNNSVIECHLDIEEANAALIKNGDTAEIII
ncbi:MAG: phosphate propanoyltransferase [Endomicrobium sp.]|jgi:putative phosphotransacetylase|nr:phosphate propanoyltransferase [Endomicrobium sp.]